MDKIEGGIDTKEEKLLTIRYLAESSTCFNPGSNPGGSATFSEYY